MDDKVQTLDSRTNCCLFRKLLQSAYGDGDGKEWSEKKVFVVECFFPREAFSKVGSTKKSGECQ